MSFEKDNYVVVRKVLSKSWCNFFMTYYDLKRLCLKTLSERREISPFDAQYGYWGDQQVTNTYATYGDLNGETLLLKFKPILEKHTHLKLPLISLLHMKWVLAGHLCMYLLLRGY